MASPLRLPLEADTVKIPSPQLRVMLRWFDALATHNLEALEAILADDYVHYILPQSLGLPTYDRAGFLRFAQKVLMPFLTQYEYSIFDVIETSDRVVLHTIANGTTSTGYAYSNELLLVAHVVQQPHGEYKIKTLKEFVDVGMVMSGFFAEEIKRMEATVINT